MKPVRDLDLRRRAILGVFLFNPAWQNLGPKGFRARTIAASAPHTFHKLWPSKRNSRASAVAAVCNSMVRIGWLYKIGSVKSLWEEKEYQSPVYAPTETGIMCVLTRDEFDLSALVDMQKKSFKLTHWSFGRYDPFHIDNNEAFSHFIGYSDDERDHIVYPDSPGRWTSRRINYED
jgi:hypothetical protein